jgi:hypothetical protein
MFAYADMPFTCRDGAGNAIVGCMEKSNALIPPNDFEVAKQNDGITPITFEDVITAGIIDYQKTAGYVEFIGEAVLDGMTKPIMMNALLNADPLPSQQAFVNRWAPYRTQVFNRLGTTAWAWSDADGSYGPTNNNTVWDDDMGLSDVPNTLSGTAFITNPGWSHGLAYNAETLVNFRTAVCGGDSLTAGDGGVTQDALNPCASYAHGNHRVDNYRVGASPADAVNAYNTAGAAPDSSYPTKRSASAAAHPKTLPGAIAGFNPLAENRAVIVHNENGIVANSVEPYVYWWNSNDGESRCDEQGIAFNNTWGPTLADGDDYDLSASFADVRTVTVPAQFSELPPENQGLVNVNGDQWNLRALGCPIGNNIDDFDCWWSIASGQLPYNSVAEVDEAIRAAGQTFTAYYMHGDIFDKSNAGLQRNDGISSTDTLTTQFVSFFPTKFFHFERRNVTGGCGTWNQTPFNLNKLIADRAINMTAYPKVANVQVWDTEENPIGVPTNNQCISPATLAECFTATQNINFPFEVGVMGINHVKEVIAPGVAGQPAGRVYFDLLGGSDKGGPTATFIGNGTRSDGFVGLLYAFEWDGFPPSVIAHWRSMHR